MKLINPRSKRSFVLFWFAAFILAVSVFASSTTIDDTGVSTSTVYCGVITNNSGYVQVYKLLVENGTSFPVTASSGYLFLRSDLNALYFYNGTDWTVSTSSPDDDSLYLLSASASNFLLQNGTRALTADWNTGAYGIYGCTWVNSTSVNANNYYLNSQPLGFVGPYTFLINQSSSVTQAWYGANGTKAFESANASAVINNAIGNTSGGWISLKGHFYLTNSIIMNQTAGTILQGMGMGQWWGGTWGTIIEPAVSNLVLVCMGDVNPVIGANPATYMPVVRDIAFWHNRLDGLTGIRGMNVSNALNVEITRCSFTELDAGALDVRRVWSGLHVNKCMFEHCGNTSAAITFGQYGNGETDDFTTGVRFEYNEILQSYNRSIDMTALRASSFSYNYIEGTRVGTVDYPVNGQIYADGKDIITYPDGSTAVFTIKIDHNSITLSGGDAIHVTNQCYEWIIDKNDISTDPARMGMYDGIYFAGWSRATITGNDIGWMNYTGISITSHDCIISENTVMRCSNDGILLWEANNNTVSDNLVSNNGYAGIQLGANSTLNTIVGNHAFGSNATLQPVGIADNAGNIGVNWGNSIQGNHVYSNSLAGIALVNVTHETVFSNTAQFNGIGIQETGTGTIGYNDIQFNNLQNNTTPYSWGPGIGVTSHSKVQYNLGYVTEASGSQASVVNGTWIALPTGFAGSPTSIVLTLNCNSYINASSAYLQPTVIAENSTHFQIGFVIKNGPINRASGLTPTYSTFGSVTNNASINDGVSSTFATCQTNSTTGATAGTVDLNFTSSFTPMIITVKVGAWCNTSNFQIAPYYSTDGTTYISNWVVIPLSVSNTAERVYTLIYFSDAQYFRLFFYSGAAQKLDVKLYEVTALDFTGDLSAVAIANAQTVNWQAVYAP